MEAWKKFELSGKVEDYLAYCRGLEFTKENAVAGQNERNVKAAFYQQAGGSNGTTVEGDRAGACGYQCK